MTRYRIWRDLLYSLVFFLCFLSNLSQKYIFHSPEFHQAKRIRFRYNLHKDFIASTFHLLPAVTKLKFSCFFLSVALKLLFRLRLLFLWTTLQQKPSIRILHMFLGAEKHKKKKIEKSAFGSWWKDDLIHIRYAYVNQYLLMHKHNVVEMFISFHFWIEMGEKKKEKIGNILSHFIASYAVPW